MSDTYFLLSPVIMKNFDRNTQKKFLTKYRMYNEYVRQNISFEEFVQEKIHLGEIKIQELEDYLFKDLLYGNQRMIYMYELLGNYRRNQNKNSILTKIQEHYAYVSGLKYHSILQQPYDDSIKELVSVKVETGYDINIIQKIILIFSEKCTVSNRSGMHSEYSYITVVLDYVQKALFIKVKPKTRVTEFAKTPEQLVEKYYSIVTNMFELKINPFVNVHKETLCKMNMDLYNQIYKKVVKNQPKELEKFIDETSESIRDLLQIKDYKEKVAVNNIYDVSDMLNKMSEHILITDMLIETASSGILDDVEGYVTYIKFNDGTNISARIRGEQYIEPIFASEAFMALRASINNAKKITILKISWLNDYYGSRVSYDATNALCLQIHLYKHHTKEEFDYAVKKYRECESRRFSKGVATVAMEA